MEVVLNGRLWIENPNSTLLTANHLLLLGPGERYPPGTFLKTNFNVKRKWSQIENGADALWTR